MKSDEALHIIKENDRLLEEVYRIIEIIQGCHVEYYRYSHECTSGITCVSTEYISGTEEELLVAESYKGYTSFPLWYLEASDDTIIQDIVEYDKEIKRDLENYQGKKAEEARYKEYLKLKEEFEK